MNFKLTSYKTIIALIVSIAIGIWAYTSKFLYDAPGYLIQQAKIQSFIIWFIISFVLVYIIWSLFQNKQKKK